MAGTVACHGRLRFRAPAIGLATYSYRNHPTRVASAEEDDLIKTCRYYTAQLESIDIAQDTVLDFSPDTTSRWSRVLTWVWKCRFDSVLLLPYFFPPVCARLRPLRVLPSRKRTPILRRSASVHWLKNSIRRGTLSRPSVSLWMPMIASLP